MDGNVSRLVVHFVITIDRHYATVISDIVNVKIYMNIIVFRVHLQSPVLLPQCMYQLVQSTSSVRTRTFRTCTTASDVGKMEYIILEDRRILLS